MSTAPKCVLISDVHYSLQNLNVADTAFRAAIDKAAELKIPLIDCGDITNDKAIIRGEVANTLITTMLYARTKGVPVYLLVGNHSLVNEKSKDHVLNFLRPYANIADSLFYLENLDLYLLPYQNNQLDLEERLTQIPAGSTVIMHQGFLGAYMGDYVQDRTSISVDKVSQLKVYSGHYHQHQTLGTVTYVGSPYTITFGEANDGPKGYLILNHDNSFKQVPLNLRRHIKIECNASDIFPHGDLGDDIFWYKISGTRDELKKLNVPMNAKVELIYTDEPVILQFTNYKLPTEVLESIIDSQFENSEYALTLNTLWKELIK